MDKINKEKLLKNLPFRIMILFLFLIPFIFYREFFVHLYSHFTGSIISSVITSQWHIVILNILVFVSFLIPLSYRKKINWKEYGIVTAFFVSLFVEMYGIPLTIFFVSKTINPSSYVSAEVVYSFEFLGVGISMDLAMTYSIIVMTIGMLLIILGWITLYRNVDKNEIVSNGVYSISRHPQYLGFILIIIGWFIGWPTILTTIFTIILIYMYVRVCSIEEKELSHISNYKLYKEKVPFFI